MGLMIKNTTDPYIPKYCLKEKKECYWKLFDDITSIDSSDISLSNFVNKSLL